MTKTSRLCAILLNIALLALVPVLASAQIQVYVSPTGDDSASGLSISTPVQTLQRAVLVMEAQRHQTTSPATFINMAAGEYQLSTPLLLDSIDSNLTFLGPPGNTAIMSGGVSITGWSQSIPSNIESRLSPQALNNVYAATIPTANLGILQRRGGAEPGTAFQDQPAELFVDGQPMSLARFPTSGWAVATSVNGDGVTATMNMARRTTAIADAWVQGFWSSDGWETWEPLTAAPTTSQIQVAGLQMATNLGPITAGARFAVVNSLEDLNQPGQYYIDRTGGQIYFYPMASLGDTTTELSQVDGYLADGYAVSNLQFENLVFQASRGQGVQLYACTNSGLHNCIVRGTQLEGVYLTAGTNNYVTNCQISNTGSCGILSIEGDVPTLTSGGDQIIENFVSGAGRMEQTCRPAVWVRGVGATVSCNTIANLPGQGIMIDGCNHLVTENDISNTCTTMSDVGVIYQGQNITNRGNVISLNIIHDVPAVVAPRWGDPIIVGVYLDDFSSGFTVQENIFYNIGIGVLIGGGRSNTIYSNAFDNVTLPVWIDARGMNWAASFYAVGGSYQTQLAAMTTIELALFEATYPDFLDMITAPNPALPEGNAVNNAYFPTSGVGVHYLDPEYTVSLLQVLNPLYNGDIIFVNPPIGNYTLFQNAAVSTTLPESAGANGGSEGTYQVGNGGTASLGP